MSAPDGRFPTTDWTLISRLKSRDETVARRALNELCAQYHYPLYCYIRRRGMMHHDAQDALHDFLTKLLRLGSFNEANEEAGRLRGFLVVALRRFLSNWFRDHERLRQEISLECTPELSEAEARFQHEHLTEHETPERIFERKWAHELLRVVMTRLQSQYSEAGKADLFAALRPVLLAGGSLRGEPSHEIAQALAMTPGSLRVALSRLLQDYRAILREEVRHTVQEDEQVDAEIAQLMNVLHKI